MLRCLKGKTEARMRTLRQILACLVLAFLPTILSAAQEIHISANQVDAFLKNSLDKYADKDSRAWGARLYRLLAANHDADETARALAKDDRLPVKVETNLISLWMKHTQLRNTRERSQSPDVYASKVSQLKQQSIAAVRASGNATLVIQFVAGILSSYIYGRCELDSFEALIADNSDPLNVGLTAAQETQCTPWWLALHARFPSNMAIRATLSAKDRELSLGDRLALLEGLNSPAQRMQQWRASLMMDYVSDLWDGGLIEDGLAAFDSAAEADRRIALSDAPLAQSFTVDGVYFQARNPEQRGDFRLDYVAALYLAGHVDSARKAFDALPYTQELRSRWDCIGHPVKREANQTKDRCDLANSVIARRWQFIESTFNHSEQDPYLLIEGGPSVGGDSAMWTEFARRRLTGDNYKWLRQHIAETWVGFQRYAGPPERDALVSQYLDKDVRLKSAAYDRRIQSAIASWNVPVNSDRAIFQRQAATPPPLPSGFRELPLPAALRTVRSEKEPKPEWPNGMSRLPQGFSPVRVERGTSMTVAVSVSQNLDPVGEVSRGAYWIHLSHDGGVTWRESLYTGLPEYFPYVVTPTSKMPLLSGDLLTLEVAVQELDTGSITYPPVALRSKRRASDLYLEIPIASLQSDRDGDGLTDIVEEHLLLNPDNPDSDGDGVPDGLDPLPNVKNAGSGGGDALRYILQHIFNLPEGAIIEPVDRALDPASMLDRKFAEEPGLLRPLLVHGTPEEFAGVRLATSVLVYSDAQVAELLAHSPDFHALSLTPVVFNRAHDRGYVTWDRGWTGGTLRVIREKKSWRVEVMGSWIT
jgi:hypothetical protein